ncbi:hypothetical protein PUN4_750024 [Paraburkholderia unamae]|nr:hypothetical protein PUN4_750024 [Paraburkholderia unamae]
MAAVFHCGNRMEQGGSRSTFSAPVPAELQSIARDNPWELAARFFSNDRSQIYVLRYTQRKPRFP